MHSLLRATSERLFPPRNPSSEPTGAKSLAGDSLVPRVLTRETATVVAMALIAKVMLFLLGYLGYETVMDRRIPGFESFLRIWVNWDAYHYLSLAEFGYRSAGDALNLLVFFPLYPWLTRLAAIPTENYVLAAFIVSTIASLAAAVLLYRLARLDFDHQRALNAVWFLLIFPTSYFLHIPYTESLFLALVVGSFLAARQQQWEIAGIAGALACLTRLNGMILLPALMVEAYLQYRVSRRWDMRWLWILAVVLGLDAYFALNYVVTGSSFTFLEIQRDNWFKAANWPWLGIRGSFDSLAWRGPADRQMIGIQELVFISIGFVGAVAALVKLRLSYGVWMLGNWLLITSSSFVVSTPRYTLAMFPLYLILAALAERRAWYALITTWSLLFLAFFTLQYVRGWWAF